MDKHLFENTGTKLSQPLVVSDDDEPLIDILLPLSRSSDKENACCMSHYMSNQTNSTCPPNKLKVAVANMDRSVCSSSCENLRTEDDTMFSPTRLAKANSDNPVFGSQSSNCVPPIPPRDYLWHAPTKTPKPVEIHPVIQDGEKLSHTHYWLLPGKQLRGEGCDGSETKRKKEDYMNFKEVEKVKGAKICRGGAINSLLSKDLKIGRLLCDGRTGDDDEPLLGGEGENLMECSYDSMTIHAMLDPEIKVDCDRRSIVCPAVTKHFDSHERCTSLGEAKDMIEKVHAAVEGMTLDECQTALSVLQWNAEAAIKYLKVESLFRLALTSRSQCRKVLEGNQWDLNKAASNLLDLSTAAN